MHFSGGFMRVLFIYTFFLKQNGEGLSVGGVETYIQNLIPLFESLGCSTIVVQKADFDFVKKYKNSTIVGVKCKGKKYKHVLYKKARTLIDANNDFLIFASDLLNVKNDVKKSICIQHGIYWDKPTFSNNKLYNFRVVNFAKKMREAYEILRWPLLTNRVVCVDYNYLNWYRSMLYYKEPSKRIVPILNFTDIPPLCSSKQSDDKTIKIIFARRFFNYRGTRIFAEAISRVLCKYTNIEVTVSGDGPDENFLIEKLGQFRNVVFTKYDSFESLKVHMDKHIAIVPTLGSEGRHFLYWRQWHRVVLLLLLMLVG